MKELNEEIQNYTYLLEPDRRSRANTLVSKVRKQPNPPSEEAVIQRERSKTVSNTDKKRSSKLFSFFPKLNMKTQTRQR